MKLPEKSSRSISKAEIFGTGLSASYDIKDLPYLEKQIIEIRTNKSESKYLDSLIQGIEDKFHDRRSGPNRQHCQPTNTSFDKNALTTEGIRLTNQNITGEDRTHFVWMVSGTGNSKKPNMYSEKLEIENARMPIDTQGWFITRGTTLVQGCKFIDSLPTATIVEFGSVNSGDPEASNHALWWRTRITSPSQYIEHEQYNDVYLHIHIIDLRSISE